MAVLLLLAYHPQLQHPAQRLHQRGNGLQDLLVYVFDLGAHRLQVSPVELYQFVVLLQVLVGLPAQVLPRAVTTLTVERCPMAWVEFWFSLYSSVLMKIINIT